METPTNVLSKEAKAPVLLEGAAAPVNKQQLMQEQQQLKQKKQEEALRRDQKLAEVPSCFLTCSCAEHSGTAHHPCDSWPFSRTRSVLPRTVDRQLPSVHHQLLVAKGGWVSTSGRRSPLPTPGAVSVSTAPPAYP